MVSSQGRAAGRCRLEDKPADNGREGIRVKVAESPSTVSAAVPAMCDVRDRRPSIARDGG
jgi:hypothetical protein